MITVNLVGKLQKDPTIEKKDYFISRFSVVVSENQKTKDGKIFEKKTFFVCNCFGSLAESTQGLKAGSTVAISGRLRIESGEFDGSPTTTNFVDIKDIEEVGKQLSVQIANTVVPTSEVKNSLPDSDDDIPF